MEQKTEEGEILDSQQSELLVESKSHHKGSKVTELKSAGSCLVNMSRMTGRKHRAMESQDWGDIDIMHSISYVKGPISKKIDIG